MLDGRTCDGSWPVTGRCWAVAPRAGPGPVTRRRSTVLDGCAARRSRTSDRTLLDGHCARRTRTGDWTLLGLAARQTDGPEPYSPTSPSRRRRCSHCAVTAPSHDPSPVADSIVRVQIQFYGARDPPVTPTVTVTTAGLSDTRRRRTVPDRARPGRPSQRRAARRRLGRSGQSLGESPTNLAPAATPLNLPVEPRANAVTTVTVT
jgi:hypothetical protein